MTHFNFQPILRWVFSSLSKHALKSPFYAVHSNFRFYGLRAFEVEENEMYRKITSSVKKEAQSALLDYLHSTRNMQFLDAEYMSKNAPHFLRKIIKLGVNEPNVGRSVSRFLRYHPINEFEPFFESIGLEPCKFVHILPRDLMYLSDEAGLVENYHVLCEYGVARKDIGKIFSHAREVFRYDHGVLQSKLLALQGIELSQDVVIDVVRFCPHVLIGDMYKEFVKVMKRLKGFGFEFDWVKRRLLENYSYNWRRIDELLCMLSDFGCDDKEIGVLIGKHPEILFDCSGKSTFSLIGFVLKLGSTKNDICSMFLQFPSVKVGKFTWNLRRVSELLIEIEMDAENIGWIMRPNLPLLGKLSLKKANSIQTSLSVGKRRLCDIIIANPLELKKWVLGAKVDKLPDDPHSHIEKFKFLTRLGFEENSKQMKKALKLFRGKGEELQDRFDCLVQAGLGEKDVAGMIKSAPQILNQSKEVIEAKIELLVNDFGHPVSTLKSFPGFISYNIGRVKLRYSMYKWLSDQRVVHPSLCLSTFIACTESYFLRRYVSKHPKGLEVWWELKKKASSL